MSQNVGEEKRSFARFGPVECGTASRRDVLRVGALTALGLSLPDLFRLQAQAAAPKAKACILVWLDGGPSHLETFDPKPDVPADVRGPFRPIQTKIPGIAVCEHLPRTAKVIDRIAILRSMTSPLGEHGIANQYLLTGYKPSPALDDPSYGAVVARVRGGDPVLPPSVAVPEFRPSAGAGFLGPAYQPFATGGDPARPDFRVRDLSPFAGVTADRLRRRRDFLAEFDTAQAALEKAAPTDPTFEQAYRLATSPEAKRAFDLNEEKPEVRGRYGPRTIGQSCLLARRLVERGVPFVSVLNTGWDTHDSLVLQLRDGYSGAKVGVGLVPTFDQAFSALISDLHERGLLESTLVIAMGEFGRTPKLNSRGGRDHWPRAFSVVLAGGGVRGGQVVGSSDRVGESPKDDPVTPADLARTIYTLLGIDPDHELHTPDGRPVPVNQGGTVIRGLM
ncbi:MAG TPA: DUF1501 domain-containing protein [Gemmataceae bacterium]|nr:DUF1501 domain-containing protein [Gemmataceae bacterium]